MSFMFVCPLCPKLSVGLLWRRSGVGSLPFRNILLPRKRDLTFCSGIETSTGWRSVTTACISHYCKAWWFWCFLCCAASSQLVYIIFVEAICSLNKMPLHLLTCWDPDARSHCWGNWLWQHRAERCLICCSKFTLSLWCSCLFWVGSRNCRNRVTESEGNPGE